MKNEILISLIKELFGLDGLHQEYQDNDNHFVIDSRKEGDKLIIEIELKEDTRKKEFEKWCENIPDDIFQEALEIISEDYDINNIYESENFEEVICAFKKAVGKVVEDRIEKLKSLC